MRNTTVVEAYPITLVTNTGTHTVYLVTASKEMAEEYAKNETTAYGAIDYQIHEKEFIPNNLAFDESIVRYC